MDSLQVITPGRIRRPRPIPAPEPAEPVTRARSSGYCPGCQYPAPVDETGYCAWCRSPETGPIEIRQKIARLRNGHELAHRSGIIDDSIHYTTGSIISVR